LLLVLSMGVDYGIFIVEGRKETEALGAALLSVLVATVSTLVSFGLLALSHNPALRALGTTTAVGVTLSACFAPATLLLLRADGRLSPPERRDP
jgi:predicted exporter